MSVASVVTAACGPEAPTDRVVVSGYVEATEVHVAPDIGGRVVELRATEGARIAAGEIIGRLDSRDVELAIQRGQAELRQAEAQLRLLQAGPRPEEVRQAEAQRDSLRAEGQAVEAELNAAEADLQRFEALLRSGSGSQKQRDDAATRRDVARERMKAAQERERSAGEAVARLRAGSRRQEIDAAGARVAAAQAQLATLEESLSDTTVRAPVAGVITEISVDAGETVSPRAPLVVITDLDRAWANVFVDEPYLSRIRLEQSAIVRTDAGERLEGRVTFVSPRAEFTPRNVQTAEERSKLVYRLKVSVDNRQGILKPGMPVEAEIPLQASPSQ